MSGHQSGGVVLTEAELEVWDVCPRCGVETYSHNDLGRTIRPQTCDLRVPEARIAAIESILTARLAAQAGRVAEVVEKVLREAGLKPIITAALAAQVAAELEADHG